MEAGGADGTPVVARRTAVSETSPKLRAELAGIPTYKPGKPAAAGGPVAYKLSSNENPYPPLPGVMETVTAAVSISRTRSA